MVEIWAETMAEGMEKSLDFKDHPKGYLKVEDDLFLGLKNSERLRFSSRLLVLDKLLILFGEYDKPEEWVLWGK